MAKKNTKQFENVNDENILSCDKNIVIKSETEMPNEIIENEIPVKKSLKDMDINELISFEKACSLLCKRFETVAKLDITNNHAFLQYQKYYDMIFNELKVRVKECCEKYKL